jgi:hypothetical protein
LLKKFLEKITIKELADFGKSAGPSPKLPPADLESKSTSGFENL